MVPVLCKNKSKEIFKNTVDITSSHTENGKTCQAHCFVGYSIQGSLCSIVYRLASESSVPLGTYLHH